MPRRPGLPPPAAVLALLLVGAPAVAEPIAPADRRSGFDQMGPEIQAMQRDETANPGMLAVADGAELWATPPAPGRQPCAGCHGEAAVGMRGVAARYPAWDARTGRPIDLQDRVNACRRTHQGADPLAYESPDLLALTAFVAAQSRGMPIAPPDDPGSAPRGPRAARCSRRARASSASPARSATTTTGAAASARP